MLWRRSVESLLAKGYDLLEGNRRNFEQALDVAKELRKRRNSGAYEIEARAHWELGRRGRAIAVLEDGARAFPSVFILWSYLGHYLSDEGRYDEALSAFERARALPGARVYVEDLNIATVYYRQGRHDEALARLATIPPPPHGPAAWHVDDVRTSALSGAGRYEEALEVATAALKLIGGSPTPPPGMAARFHAEAARAIWLGRHDGAAALEEAWAAIEADKGEETAMWLIRDVHGQLSAGARAWRLQLMGVWPWRMPGVQPQTEFIVVYQVIADDAEEAIVFVRPFEPPEVRSSLRILEAEDNGPKPDALKGVYGSSDYVFSRQRKLDLGQDERKRKA